MYFLKHSIATGTFLKYLFKQTLKEKMGAWSGARMKSLFGLIIKKPLLEYNALQSSAT